MLHPKPNWAKQLEARQLSRRRRNKEQGKDQDGSTSTEESIADDSSSDESISAKPLTKLLKDMDSLTKDPVRHKNSARIFRPEIIDVQRSKDITGPQRVSPACFTGYQ